jgi:hypothetical protein
MRTFVMILEVSRSCNGPFNGFSGLREAFIYYRNCASTAAYVKLSLKELDAFATLCAKNLSLPSLHTYA